MIDIHIEDFEELIGQFARDMAINCPDQSLDDLFEYAKENLYHNLNRLVVFQIRKVFLEEFFAKKIDEANAWNMLSSNAQTAFIHYLGKIAKKLPEYKILSTALLVNEEIFAIFLHKGGSVLSNWIREENNGMPISDIPLLKKATERSFTWLETHIALLAKYYTSLQEAYLAKAKSEQPLQAYGVPQDLIENIFLARIRNAHLTAEYMIIIMAIAQFSDDPEGPEYYSLSNQQIYWLIACTLHAYKDKICSEKALSIALERIGTIVLETP